MLKFRCQHCGHRIAVDSRHLGKLVTCPECGKPTHPLAEKIVSLQGEAARIEPKQPSPRASPVSIPEPKPIVPEEFCANCRQTLGQLQERAQWEGHTVCAACGKRLAEEQVIRDAHEQIIEPSVAIARAGIVIDAEDAFSAARLVARGASVARRLVISGASAVNTLNEITRASGPLLPSPSESQKGTELERPAPGADNSTNPAQGLSLRNRGLLLLGIVCLAGAAVYGALGLLRDLAGYVTSAALVLLGASAIYLVVRASMIASRKLMPGRSRRMRDEHF